MDCRNRTSRAVDGRRWAVISHQSSVFADSGCSPVGQCVSPAWGGGETVEKQKLGKQKAEMGLRDHRADPINRRWRRWRRWRRYTQIRGLQDYLQTTR